MCSQRVIISRIIKTIILRAVSGDGSYNHLLERVSGIHFSKLKIESGNWKIITRFFNNKNVTVDSRITAHDSRKKVGFPSFRLENNSILVVLFPLISFTLENDDIIVTRLPAFRHHRVLARRTSWLTTHLPSTRRFA